MDLVIKEETEETYDPCNNFEEVEQLLYDLQEVTYTTMTIKELIYICEYYKLDINFKRFKKHELIQLIICFESDISNFEMVSRRNELWRYLNVLKSDSYMKRFIIY